MASQQWVTVQQKTFTKWSVLLVDKHGKENTDTVILHRLNTKIKSRDIVVNDLVKDLSDGVSVLV